MAKVCKKVALVENGKQVGIRFDFAHGESRKVMFADFSQEVRDAAEAHGFTQTLGDSYSGSDGKPDIALAKFEARLGNLQTGDWNSREGGGGQADEDLIIALAEVTGKSEAEARKAVGEGNKEWKEARRKHKAVAAVIARLQAERKQAKVRKEDMDTKGLI